MRCSILVFVLVAAPLFAQQSPVPEIRYRSVPDFLKLPADLYFGEVAGVAVNSKGDIFVFSRGNTTGPPTEPVPHNCWSSVQTANSYVRSATTCTRGLTRTRSRSIARTTSGLPIRARTWSLNSILRDAL
jgi:hypothetical protein